MARKARLRVKDYSVELAKLLYQLKESGKVPNTKALKDLIKEERKIFMRALHRSSNATRKKLFELINKDQEQ